MELPTFSFQSCDSLTPEHEDLRFVVIYESLATALRAQRFCEELARKLGSTCALQDRLWRCDLLSLPILKTEAAEAALQADFVVLSLSGENTVSPAVLRWLENWLPRTPVRHPSLVALFDPTTARSDSVTATRRYLKGVATSARVDFFAACATAPPIRFGAAPENIRTLAGSEHAPPPKTEFAHSPSVIPHGNTPSTSQRLVSLIQQNGGKTL